MDSGEPAARVKEAWLSEHNGEPVRLDRAAVCEIAWRLVQARLQPTGEAIRAVNGGSGSPNVIHPALRDFFASELHRRWETPDVQGVPKALVQLWKTLEHEAMDRTQVHTKAERAALAAERSALEEERATAAQRTREIDERNASRERLVETLDAELQRARTELAAKDAERARLLEVFARRDKPESGGLP